jgi:hypothetical protein
MQSQLKQVSSTTPLQNPYAKAAASTKPKLSTQLDNDRLMLSQSLELDDGKHALCASSCSVAAHYSIAGPMTVLITLIDELDGLLDALDADE